MTGGGSPRRWPGASLIGAGALAIASAAIVFTNGGAPVDASGYRYELGDDATTLDEGIVNALEEAGAVVRSARIVSTDGRLLGELDLAQVPREGDDRRILLDWRPRVDPPFLFNPAPVSEVVQLSAVLSRHVQPGDTLLSWWDTAQRFELFSGIATEFGEHLGQPLFVPRQWQVLSSSPAAEEEAFWGGHGDEAVHARFNRFVDALLSPEAEGVDKLRALAGADGNVILVLHVRDMIMLGQMAPDRIGVAFRDYALTGDIHGMIKGAQAWLRQQGYTAYAATRLADGGTRVVALTDEPSRQSLAARLLPFIGAEQGTVDGSTLVYTAGGFWVYRI